MKRIDMENVWQIAFTVAGLGGIASFVIWSLFKEWLRLPIFQQLTKEHQFKLFKTFLYLTFSFAVIALGSYTYLSFVSQQVKLGSSPAAPVRPDSTSFSQPSQSEAVKKSPMNSQKEDNRGEKHGDKIQFFWHENSQYKYLTWIQAQTYCENLSADGYENWRLPTRAEFENQKDIMPTILAMLPDKDAPYFWTATSFDETEADLVEVDEGIFHHSQKNREVGYVVCIRPE